MPEFAAQDRFPILQFFNVNPALSDRLKDIAEPFRVLAWQMAERPTSNRAELAAGLRHLLEAKDCAVRAALP